MALVRVISILSQINAVPIMPPETPPPPPFSVIMTLGLDTLPAAALAHACGLPLQIYDLAALTAALGQGQRCVVVWTDPAFIIASCLRNQTACSAAMADWRQATQTLLDLFAHNRRRLLLVAASLITRGAAVDLARLAARLPLKAPLVTRDLMPDPNGANPDLPAVLARIAGPHLADLSPVLAELQACSLSIPDDSVTSADLDALAQLLARQSSELALLNTSINDAAARHQSEASLQREAMQDLAASLVETSQILAQTQTQPLPDEQRLTRLDLEARLLRDQLIDLSNVLTHETLAHQSAIQHLRSDLFDALHPSQPASIPAQREIHPARSLGSGKPGPGPVLTQSSVELGLLRDQLTNVTVPLQGGAQPIVSSAIPDIGASHIQIEQAFATLLAALVTETGLRFKAQQDAMPDRLDLTPKLNPPTGLPAPPGS